MLKIALVTMPFGPIESPSLALTQLKSVLHHELGERVGVRIVYLSQAFARQFGHQLYLRVAYSRESGVTLLGEWLFRQVAFPEHEDNAREYLARFYPDRQTQDSIGLPEILAERDRLGEVLAALIDEYALDRADIVGFTSMFSQNVPSIALARLLKERNPRLITIMGGPNCDHPMGAEIARHVPWLDFVFSGPALRSLPEFVRCLLAGDRQLAAHVRGVHSREVGPRTSEEELGEDRPIDAGVPLEYDEFLRELAPDLRAVGVEPYLYFETSRGCSWGKHSPCTFCALNGPSMDHRVMGPETALGYLRALLRYADRCRHFEAVDNLMPKSYLRNVFPMLEVEAGVSLLYEVRLALSDRDLATMERAGVRTVQAGLESLCTSTLQMVGKGTNAFQVIAFLKRCLVNGVRPVWNLLIGFPGEPREVYEKYLEDVPLLVHLQPPVDLARVRYYRYSRYFTNPGEFGLELEPLDCYSLIYPLPGESIGNLAYRFADHGPLSKDPALSPELHAELRELIACWSCLWSASRPEGQPVLLLSRTDGKAVITDSRSGHLERYPISDAAARLLDCLERPRNLSELVDALGSTLHAREIASGLAELAEHGLLFLEQGRQMSLVLTAPPKVVRA